MALGKLQKALLHCHHPAKGQGCGKPWQWSQPQPRNAETQEKSLQLQPNQKKNKMYDCEVLIIKFKQKRKYGSSIYAMREILQRSKQHREFHPCLLLPLLVSRFLVCYCSFCL